MPVRPILIPYPGCSPAARPLRSIRPIRNYAHFFFNNHSSFTLQSSLTKLRVPARDMEDNKLIIRLQHADPTAIGDLYEAYGPALFSIALRIVKSSQLAEQVLQDTFVKVWRSSNNYDASKGRLFTWLLNIARNTAIDATRTAHFQHYNRMEDIGTMTYQLHTEPMSVDTLDIHQVAARLEDKYHRLIDLVYFQGYGQQEAADLVGIPLGTLKTRLRHAISLLRHTFQEPQGSFA